MAGQAGSSIYPISIFVCAFEGPVTGAEAMGVVPGSQPNALWIVVNGQQTLSTNVASGGYAQLRLIPSTSGQVIINEIYPNGQVITSAGNPVNPRSMYRMGFVGDMAGLHTLSYTINGAPSNQVQINVGGGGGGGCSPGTTPCGLSCCSPGQVCSNGQCIDVPGPGPGPGPGPQPGQGGCSVWTDKQTYNVGEMVTIHYSVSNGCTAQMTIRSPQGLATTYGPNYVPATTRTKVGQAWYPVGVRTVTLQTWGGSHAHPVAHTMLLEVDILLETIY
jgi:hypothetical protein